MKTIFRFAALWGAGFVFLFVLSLLGLLALVAGSAMAWVFFLLVGSSNNVSLEWSAVFAFAIAPYIVGRALPDLLPFMKVNHAPDP
ncbi:MAG: hypothetical protein HY017_29855 [Betaproteobacteria bacterium]|nr:hypothetical protein [Betaproteobacteria bacterium]